MKKNIFDQVGKKNKRVKKVLLESVAKVEIIDGVMKKESFNKFNLPDLFSQLITVLKKQDSKKLDNIAGQIKNLSKEVFKEI